MERGSSTTLVGQRVARNDDVVSLRSGKKNECLKIEQEPGGGFSPPGVSEQKTGGDAAPAGKEAGNHTFFMEKDFI